MAAEKQFENKIKKYLQDKGCWLVKFFANRMTSVGVPDILACVNGWFVAVEVKAENGKMSKLQFYQMTKILQAGGIHVLLYPDGFEDFRALVEALLAGNKKLADTIEKQIFLKGKQE